MLRDTQWIAATGGAKIFVHRVLPDQPTLIVQIVHGMAEHSERYLAFAEHLARYGCAVFAHDHRGHGRTQTPEDILGHFADENGWDKVCADIVLVKNEAQRLYPSVPVVLFAHSMGSFMAQTLFGRGNTSTGPANYDAWIFSGTDDPGGMLKHAGLGVAKLERFRQGPRGKSILMDKLSFGAYNNEFQPTRTDFDWLSRDEKVVDAYVADPKCGFRVSNQLWVDLLGALTESGSRSDYAQAKEVPVLLFGGSKDPVGRRGAGLSDLMSRYQRHGFKRVTLKVYPDARHEMLNEINRDEVFEDIRLWLSENNFLPDPSISSRFSAQ